MISISAKTTGVRDFQQGAKFFIGKCEQKAKTACNNVDRGLQYYLNDQYRTLSRAALELKNEIDQAAKTGTAGPVDFATPNQREAFLQRLESYKSHGVDNKGFSDICNYIIADYKNYLSKGKFPPALYFPSTKMGPKEFKRNISTKTIILKIMNLNDKAADYLFTLRLFIDNYKAWSGYSTVSSINETQAGSALWSPEGRNKIENFISSFVIFPCGRVQPKGQELVVEDDGNGNVTQKLCPMEKLKSRLYLHQCKCEKCAQSSNVIPFESLLHSKHS